VLQDMMDHKGPCIVEVFTHPKERHEPKVTHKGVDENGKITRIIADVKAKEHTNQVLSND
jgi:hypothetical protein